MVGTVTFKNFETGSYREMRITAYRGDNYADIGKGEFFSCRVSPEDKRIDFELLPPEAMDFAAMTSILYVANKARDYLLDNTHITVAEFCNSGNACNFRAISSKCGVYEPPDMKALWNGIGVYMLLKSFNTHNLIWISMLCESINFGIRRIFATSQKVFHFSGYGVYINLALFGRRGLRTLPQRIPASIKKLIPAGRTLSALPKRKALKELESFLCDRAYYKRRVSYTISLCKIRVHNRMVHLLGDAKKPSDIVRCIFSLVSDEEIAAFVAEASAEIKDYALTYKEYGYVEALSHINMLTVRDIILMETDLSASGLVAERLKARSINHKIFAAVPCPPFYDNCGTALWQ